MLSMNMNQKTLGISLIILTVIGVALTGYLAVAFARNTSVVCFLETDCNTVLASAYSNVLGIPLAFFGLAYYIALATFAVSYFRTQNPRTLNTINTVLTLGLAFYIFLFIIQAFVLQAFCIYCLSSSVVTLVLFILTAQRFKPAKFIGAAVLVAVAVLYFSNPVARVDANVETFAQCLTQKGAAMYGADWCSHCQNQKRAFGSAFKHVEYVQCPHNQQLCTEKGVTGYPTWLFPDGTRLTGEQTLEQLSRSSGCELTAQ